MTVVASEPAMRMDIARELLGRSPQFPVELRMALETAILGRQRQPRSENYHRRESHRRYPSSEKVARYAINATPAPVTQRTRLSPQNGSETHHVTSNPKPR